EERLAIRVREERLREPRQRREVAALALDQAEALARERGEPPDEQTRRQENEEGGDVARVLDREGVERRKEEEVVTRRREQRGQDPRPALPDPGREENGEEQEQGDGGRIQRREQLEQAEGRRDEQGGRRITHSGPANRRHGGRF